MTVNIVDDCPFAVLTPLSDITYNYELGTPTVAISLPLAASNKLQCNSYSYSLDIVNPALFFYSSGTKELVVIPTTDSSLIGTYKMILTAQLNLFSKIYSQTISSNIIVNVIGACVTTTINSPPISRWIYDMGSAAN